MFLDDVLGINYLKIGYKTKYIFLDKQTDKDNIPNCLLNLKISNICFERVNKLKILGFFLLYFSYIHSYINDANIVWVSTSHTKLKKTMVRQKHDVRIIFNVNKEIHARPLFQEFNTLNIYQINLFQVLTLMLKIKASTSPRVFSTYVYPINHVL